MPKLVDYADRFDGVRDAVYTITLERGVTAINLDAVAEVLQMSPRTIRRLIRSLDVLPHLGLQWAERQQMQRLLRRERAAVRSERPRSEQAVEDLLEQLPGRDDALDRQVWWQLALAHVATCDWARTAYAEQQRTLAALSEAALAGAVLDSDADSDTADESHILEVRRLHFLMSGAIAAICRGEVTHDEAVTTIRRHVADVLARHAIRDEAA